MNAMVANRLTLLALLALGACSPLPQRDGPPETPFDPSRIRPAVPKAEPLSPYGNPLVYEVNGQRYRTLASAQGYREEGIASWYGTKFHGRRTSSGEPYDMYAMTAAHKTLPLPSYVRVTNLENGRSAIVRVNDRGPFHPGRIIDLSYAAAVTLGIVERGTARVRVEAIEVPGQGTVHHPSPVPLYVQAGAFGRRANAEALRRRLARELDAPVRIEPSRGLYRVRIGPLPDLAEARAVSEALTRLGIPNPLVVND